MPRPAAKRARVTRNENHLPAQPAKSNATRDRKERRVSNRRSTGSTKQTDTADQIRVANVPETERQDHKAQNRDLGTTQTDGERRISSSQTPIRDRNQQKSVLPAGSAGKTAPLRLQAFPGSARRGDLNQRGHTPAFESSVLSAFRPRPRQPSILQLVGDDSLDLGSSELGSDDLLGSFDPEDISTPLPTASRRKTLNPADITPTVVRRSPKFPRVAVEIPAWRGFSPDLETPDEPSIAAEEMPDSPPVLNDETHEISNEQPAIIDETEDDDCSSLTSIDSLPAIDFTGLQAKGQPQWQTTVPPTSSLGNVTPPASTPDSSTKKKGRLSLAPSKYPHLSTTSIQDALLPQRRSRRKGIANQKGKRSRAGAKSYVLGAPGSEDELNYSGSQNILKETTAGQRKSKKNAPQDTAKAATQRSKRARSKAAPVPISTPPTADPSKGLEAKKTYTRLSKAGENADWDKENMPEQPEVLSDPETAVPFVSDELLRQKQKFAEVDEWSIDFEEVPDDEIGLY